MAITPISPRVMVELVLIELDRRLTPMPELTYESILNSSILLSRNSAHFFDRNSRERLRNNLKKFPAIEYLAISCALA